MAAVTVDITAKSGTPTISVWLQGTVDDGTTWVDIPCDLMLINQTAPVITDVSATEKKRNIVESTTVSAGKFVGIFKHLPFAAVRLAWAISGTTSFTFSAVLSGK